jgi:photosystem II stability/assembly factor-like uncharacterized protein
MNKFFTALAGFLFTCLSVIAQPWLTTTSPLHENRKPEQPLNFYEIEKKFKDYWENKEVSENEEENAEEGGYQQFERWAYLMKPRTYPTGDFFDTDVLAREFDQYKNKYQNQRLLNLSAGNWTYIGQNMIPSNGGGCGRINVVRIHPNNPNILFAGTASGGIWKTIDGGLTWSNSTDLLPCLSIADIAIDPLHPDTIYVATGDGYGYEVAGDFWGGVYTGGIYKSTDGGLTWNATPLSFKQQFRQIFNRIIINPLNPDVLFTCSRDYVFKSIDGGQSWSRVLAGRVYDLEYKPGDTSIVYAAQANAIYKSTNGGNSFAATQGNLGAGRMSIAVTNQNPAVLYALSENGNLWKSVDNGQTFTALSSPMTSYTFYGYYDNVLAVSPIDENYVVAGGLELIYSDDGGISWNLLANNGGNDYVHVDQKNIEFSNDGLTIYAVNDGGIFRTYDGGINWEDLGGNIHIKQYYKMATGISNPNIYYAGAQDNGTDYFDGTTWRHVLGGDGMDCAVDPTNANTSYASYQYGNFRRSLNGGLSFTNITPAGQSGAWVTPIAIDPLNTNTIYLGYASLYRSFDRGNTWSVLATNICGGDEIEYLKIAPSNNNIIYAGNTSGIYRSVDGGQTFTSITTGISGGAITDVAISSSNPDHIWVTLSGYTQGTRIFRSYNGGSNYINVSGTLPDIPVNCAIYQPASNDLVYIGTDFGVFYRDNAMPDWLPFNNNLPNVIISEFEMMPAQNKIRVATYGRGLWESPLAISNMNVWDAGITPFNIKKQYCTNAPVVEVSLNNYGTDTLTTAQISYTINNGAQQSFSWNGLLPPHYTTTAVLPLTSLTDGIQNIVAIVALPNGNADQNTINDTTAFSFFITTQSVATPLIEGFESGTTPLFRFDDPDQLLTVSNSAGGFGSSVYSLKANCYQTNTTAAEITSEPIDLSNLGNNPLLTFDVAYARYSSTLRDSLSVLLSADCGLTWTKVYQKTGSQLSTVTGLATSAFIPTASQWRTEQISLSNYANTPNLLVKFRFRSNFGNNIYVDNINLNQGVGLNENPISNLKIYPNPTSQELFVNYSGNSIHYIKLTDLSGKQIAEWNQLTLNDNLIRLELPRLKSGLYLITVNDQNIHTTLKLSVKQY